MIEWTISLGSILTLIFIVFSGVGFYWRQVYDAKEFKEDITEIKLDIKILNKVIIDMALQTERLNNISKRVDRVEVKVDELSHGEGFIIRKEDAS